MDLVIERHTSRAMMTYLISLWCTFAKATLLLYDNHYSADAAFRPRERQEKRCRRMQSNRAQHGASKPVIAHLFRSQKLKGSVQYRLLYCINLKALATQV